MPVGNVDMFGYVSQVGEILFRVSRNKKRMGGVGVVVVVGCVVRRPSHVRVCPGDQKLFQTGVAYNKSARVFCWWFV